ncbi:MAG: protease modulator HflC [Candidatus Loosdrechtia sp.]|uniref:protease modulator HflC n=1 Tax=Candidatus Loosdrechtia sp. TaxID=3101272 RepID=UPI003A68827E|nr:MAG: protease modulator HflC [Candidatus Jettenia sp. AMX2]
MNTKTISPIPIILVIAAVLILVASSLFTVDEREQAIITQFGEYVRTVDQPGLHAKMPWIQTVHRYERRILQVDLSATEYLTADRKRVLLDHVSFWRISDPLTFYRAVRTEASARLRLDEIVTGRLRREVAAHKFLDLIRVEREEIMNIVSQEVHNQAKDLGIEVVHTRIKRVDLPREVQASVFARMDAERARVASLYRAEGAERAQIIRATADREREIIIARAYETSQTIRGEGDAAATAIYAEAYQVDEDFFAFWRRLQTYERILGKNNTTLVISSGADLLRYLRGSTITPRTGSQPTVK